MKIWRISSAYDNWFKDNAKNYMLPLSKSDYRLANNLKSWVQKFSNFCDTLVT